MSGNVSFVVQTAGPAGDQSSNDQMCSEPNGFKPGDLIHIHIKNNTEALKKVLGTTNGHKVQGYYNTGWFNPEMRSRAVF